MLGWTRLDFSFLRKSLSLQPALIESMQTLPQTKNGEWKSNPHLAKQAGEWKMLAKPHNFFLEELSNGTIRLKRTHDYYIQVQGQLFVKSRELSLLYILERKCLYLRKTYHLIVATGTKNFCQSLNTFLKGPFSLKF